MKLASLAAALALGAAGGYVVARDRPPPVPEPPPTTLHRLELRVQDLDRTHPAVGGERYRAFECREVQR